MIDEKELVKVVPSSRQLLYQQIEFYAFVHFTVNTFTGLEWGMVQNRSLFFTHRR